VELALLPGGPGGIERRFAELAACCRQRVVPGLLLGRRNRRANGGPQGGCRRAQLDGMPALGARDEAQRHTFQTQRHAPRITQLAQGAADGVTGPDSMRWLERPEQEHPNLRAALEWSFDTGRGQLGGQLAAELWQFWNLRAHLRGGRGVVGTGVRRAGRAARN